MKVLGIDPGSEESGFALFDGERVIKSGVGKNQDIINSLNALHHGFYDTNEELTIVAIEMIASYGMPVGESVFETCVWIGRFVQAYNAIDATLRIKRIAIRNHLCHSSRAGDANIRQALIDRLGAPGTKKEPGPTYGVKSHAWSALAVAVTAYDRLRNK